MSLKNISTNTLKARSINIMATGRRLLEESMPRNYKQGCLYPTHYLETEEKPYGEQRNAMLDMFAKWDNQKLENS